MEKDESKEIIELVPIKKYSDGTIIILSGVTRIVDK